MWEAYNLVETYKSATRTEVTGYVHLVNAEIAVGLIFGALCAICFWIAVKEFGV